jgi:opine dehydrogenase
MAADLALRGFSVRMWSMPFDALQTIRKDRIIKVSGPLIQGEAKIHKITDDIREAVEAAELICAPVPAFSQAALAEHLSPVLKDGQVIFLSPGTFGSYAVYKSLRDRGCSRDLAIAETGTLPYLTRRINPSETRIVVRACHLPTGIFPARKTKEGVETVKTFFPAAHPVEDALSAALMNAGPVIHAPLVVLNSGPVESSIPYDIHKEGTTPGIRRIISLLDGERIAIREALGYSPNHYPLDDYYDDSRPNEWMYPRASKRLLLESGLWREKIDYRHRYVTEDIAYGLAFLISVGGLAGIDVPVARALMTLARAVAGTDFLKTGRTLSSLGLGHDITGIKTVLNKGF